MDEPLSTETHDEQEDLLSEILGDGPVEPPKAVLNDEPSRTKSPKPGSDPDEHEKKIQTDGATRTTEAFVPAKPINGGLADMQIEGADRVTPGPKTRAPDKINSGQEQSEATTPSAAQNGANTKAQVASLPKPSQGATLPAVQNKIKGALFGAALGDALGLLTDGLQTSEIVERFPRGLKFPVNVRNQGNQANDWSGLSDQMILAMRTIRECHERLADSPEHAFAQKLAHWARYGMPDLGDTACPATDWLTREAVKDQNFLLQPRTIAKKIQLRAFGSLDPEGGRSRQETTRPPFNPHSNPGALLRAIPAAFAAENQLHWSKLLTQVTHAAPKDELAARCILHFVWLAAPLREQPLPAEAVVQLFDQLLMEAQKLGVRDFEEAAFPLFIRSRELAQSVATPPNTTSMRIGADLGDAAVYRALACGLWILRSFIRGEPRTPDFVKDRLTSCAMMGGAACANTGVVGAVLGAAAGYTGLPADWLKALPFHDALAHEIELFLSAVCPPTVKK